MLHTERQRHSTPALPFCQPKLKAKKPPPAAYPREPHHIGEHIRRRRLELDFLQKEVAHEIGVDKTTILNWERGRSRPALWTLPRIIDFLGYVPFELGHTVSERLRAYRLIHGISREKLAGMLGVDEGTLWHWETKKRRPVRKCVERIEALLATSRRRDQRPTDVSEATSEGISKWKLPRPPLIPADSSA